MGKGLLLIVAAAALGSVLLMRNVQVTANDTDQEISQYEKNVIAKEIARSGMNVAVAEARGAFATLQTGTRAAVSYQRGTYQTTYTRLANGTLRIDVVGRFQHGASDPDPEEYRLSTTMVLASPLDGAILVEADSALAVFTGNSFSVDGRDTQAPSLAGNVHVAEAPQNGIKASPALVMGAFRSGVGIGPGTRAERVVGKEGIGDIVLGPSDADLQGLYQEAKDVAEAAGASGTLDNLINNGKITGNHTIGTALAPEIRRVSSDVEIAGNLRGYGMLVVDGSLSITGTFNWEGIVLAKRETGLNVDLNGNATIHGSLVLLQGSSAFTMPKDGTLRVKYLYSNAGYQSSVNLSTRNANGVEETSEIFPKGSNRNGDQFTDVVRTFPQGTKLNFFIRTWASSGTPNVYDHYARGHNAPDGTPYALVEQLDVFKWKIRFEDLNVASGHTPDWDYNDQEIEVEIVPAEGDEAPFEPWWNYAGVQLSQEERFWANVASWFRASRDRRAGIEPPGAGRPLFQPAVWRYESASAGAGAASGLAAVRGWVVSHAEAALGLFAAAPSKPSLSAPADASNGHGTSLTLSWRKPSGGPQSYRVQVSTSNGFGSTVINQVVNGGNNTSYNATGLSPSTTYYWRVMAFSSTSGSGSYSSWSTAWRFTTQGVPTAVPTLSAPDNGAGGVAANPTLDWNNVSGATSYTVQVSRASDFSTTVVNQSTGSSNHTASGLQQGTAYYWRVKACNATGCGGWSSVYSFTTVAPPDSYTACAANTGLRHLCFRMVGNAQVYYSAVAIARLTPRLARIRENARLVTVDHWTGQ